MLLQSAYDRYSNRLARSQHLTVWCQTYGYLLGCKVSIKQLYSFHDLANDFCCVLVLIFKLWASTFASRPMTKVLTGLSFETLIYNLYKPKSDTVEIQGLFAIDVFHCFFATCVLVNCYSLFVQLWIKMKPKMQRSFLLRQVVLFVLIM